VNGRFSIVLSGGGCKVFWATGALEVYRDLLPPVDAWAGVSAGAGFALAHVANRLDEALAVFVDAVERNQRNFDLRRITRRQRPCPHDDIYRATVRAVLRGEGFERVRGGAPVHILLSYIEPGERPVLTSFGAVQSYLIRRRNHVFHGPLDLPPGIGAEIVSSHQARDLDTLLDWTLMSSTIPPFTRVHRREGRRYLDGGLVDNIPIRALPPEFRGPGNKILCLVSHQVPVPARPRVWTEGAEVLYVAAGAPLPVRVWDYTSPALVHAALDLGRRDAQAQRARVEAFVRGLG